MRRSVGPLGKSSRALTRKEYIALSEMTWLLNRKIDKALRDAEKRKEKRAVDR